MKIAILGIGLRFPPNCNNLDSLWRLLETGGDAIVPVPKDRWDPRRFTDKDPDRPGKNYVAKGGYLRENPRLFDPAVFGISPREAHGLDPQQRVLLETTWEAFEDAGIPIERQDGARTGVFVGGFCLDHLLQINHPANRLLASSHSATSATMTILSNRLSYVFNLRGPSFTLDTACSSSLVALHCACQSLISGETTMALAGGVNIMMRPEFPLMMSKGRFLSEHANCRAFDASAGGYVRGEGAGLLLLKPLDAALADGDSIHAVIEGTGVNQDGRTPGISLPNSEAQEELMREVYTRAGVAPAEVDYVEAHGTGTQAGDPLEARALDSVFREGRDAEQKLLVGSIKTNFGHTEAAAGVAGVIKAVLVLKHRQVPPTLHFKTPNPKIPFSKYLFRIADAKEALPSISEKPVLHVGVNSFGYGGTNGHVVLSSAPELPSASPCKEAEPPFTLFPLSARSPEALRESASRLAFYVRRNKTASLSDLYHTLAHRKSLLNYRAGIVASDTKDLRQKLMLASNGDEQDGLRISNEPVEATRPVFVYTGMGPQWWAMGRELFETEPVCAQVLDEVEAIFRPLSGWSLKEAMLAKEADSPMMKTEVAQPANLVIQLALTRLWQQWGIEPAAVIGHSVGEVTSAVVAGVYTLEEAVLVSYHRSRLQAKEAGKGGMLAVGLPEAEVGELLTGRPGVSIAAVNSFSSVTLSGDHEELKAIAAELEAREVFHRALRVEVAYHSPQMDPIEAPILEALASLDPKPARIPLFSTVSAEQSTGAEWTADYWWRNVRQPVRFASGIQALIEQEHSLFLEVGPHPVLGNSIQEVAADSGKRCRTVFSLRRKEPEQATLHNNLAALFTLGVTPDWNAVGPRDGSFVRLPSYPWQRQLYWQETADSEMDRVGLPGPVYQNTRIHASQKTWDVEINDAFFPFVKDHRVQGQTVFPGMGYIESALFLQQSAMGEASTCLRDVDFEAVLIMNPNKLQRLVSSLDEQTGEFTISSRIEGDAESTRRHARGRLSPRPLEAETAYFPNIQTWHDRCQHEVPRSTFYDRLQRRGLEYGPHFRPVQSTQTDGVHFLAEVEGMPETADPAHLIHPTLLDGALQPVLYVAKGERMVPVSIACLRFHASPSTHKIIAFGCINHETDTSLNADVFVCDETGKPLITIEGITCQSIGGSSESALPPIYLPDWRAPEPVQAVAGSFDWNAWQLIAEASASVNSLEAALCDAGVQQLPFTKSNGDSEQSSCLDLQGKEQLLFLLPAIDASDDPYQSIRALNLCFLALLRELKQQAFEGQLVLITNSPPHEASPSVNAISALAALGQNEIEGLHTRCIYLATSDSKQALKSLEAELSQEATGEVWLDQDERRSPCLTKQVPQAIEIAPEQVSLSEPVHLVANDGKKLSDLSFQRCQRAVPQAGEVELRIHSSALNYKDLLKIYGKLHPLVLRDTFFGETLGMEVYAEVIALGSNTSDELQVGDPVIALLPDAFRSFATVPETFVVKAPSGWGANAASIPVVYLTAVHGLEKLAQLQAGERVLIHQATGGLGLAAIDVARKAGAEIFATAGSKAKREWLQQAGIQHVFPSRDLSFVESILSATAGEGVDVILSAQTGLAQKESLNLLKPGGRYIDVGKKDIINDSGLPLRAFNRNLLFAAVDIDRLLVERPAYIRGLMQGIVADFESGSFQGVATESFPAAQIEAAFNKMAQSKHQGKILIDFLNGSVETTPAETSKSVARKTGAYLITGGTSGFGLETAKWLARKGAGRVVLLSRRGDAVPGLADKRAAIEEEGAEVVVIKGDATLVADLQQARTAMSTDGFTPAGIIHGAMVLEDAFLDEMDAKRFEAGFLPKVAGALALEAVFGGASLDFLVFYSSISALIGNRGQANYIAANAFLDAYALRLRQRGMPAISINWGALKDSGVVARSASLEGALEAAGVRALSDEEALAALEVVLQADTARAAAIDLDWQVWKQAHPKLAQDPRFLEHAEAPAHGLENKTAQKLLAEIIELKQDEKSARLEREIAEVLSNVLKVSADSVKPEARLTDMGVDSLLMLELSLGLKERTGIPFTAMELLKGPNVRELAQVLLTRLTGQDTSTTPTQN
ncbi:SDR family NAD(P)-dependent oxidoreductase [Coraliomargarita sp. SDUM461004]|uniref:SDR family NAD(P)-dependent oxidoreductase n=1 Tax=Thalassobacterium sedimentorum TaxID=3041258 RepID=A0ABU1AH35_9BACT|nr:SDR family NAD(P)-dependent oxidoreductase [Coraliomargarita sp. SDUM461004]MDQ8194085.1 SDR family NAD(P)-dependent oxidoreductase [Coraliomargarita sp. SDUM461004]